MKYVVYETPDYYCVTPEKNYYSYVQDARKIQRGSKREFETMDEFVSCVLKWYRISADDIVFPKY